jgi:uncharacterized protein YecE (DUF72 family)
MAGRIVVGTAGWSAEEWYPSGLPPRDRLSWYAERFESVEVDSTFYALPARRTVARWAAISPPSFTFDVKLHRLLSRHAAPRSSLPTDLRPQAEVNERGRVALRPELEAAICRRTLELVEPLTEAGKLSSFLLQLTPAFDPAGHRLAELEPVVQALAPVPVAVELRHRDWLSDPDATVGWFRTAGAAFVCVDAPDVGAPIVLPPFDAVSRDDLAYLRAHGRNADGYLRGRTAGERFAWEYSDDELWEIADRARRLAGAAATVRLMFGNGGHAMAAARRMREILGS